jgi:tetratricopeptide (TPR) repeat protein
MKRIRYVILSLLAGVATLAGGVLVARAGDDDESMTSETVEKIIAEELGRTIDDSAPAKPAAAPAAEAPAKPAVAPAVAPAAPAAEAAPASEADAAQKLQEAQAQIAKLEDVVRRLWEAKHREEANTHYNLGCVYKASKLYRQAEAEFLQALKLDPSDPYVHYNLGILYDDDLNEPAKAKKHYAAFLELAPNDKDAGHVKEWLMSLP